MILKKRYGIGNLKRKHQIAVLERHSRETQSISVAMERWSVEHRAFAVETYFKNDSVLTQRIFRRHFNIHRNECPQSQYFFLWGYLKSKVYGKKPRTTVDLKQNIGKKWQQFFLTCRNEWCRTSRNAWGNVLTRDATSQTLYSGCECCN
jgi:hypothetical protein